MGKNNMIWNLWIFYF